jgi:hypothetical protein
MMQVPAERGDSSALQVMLDCGFDRDGVTAPHGAAMFGRADPARVLLAHSASVNPLDGMLAATPLVWAREGWSHGPQAGADHLAVARLLLAAVRRSKKGAVRAKITHGAEERPQFPRHRALHQVRDE